MPSTLSVRDLCERYGVSEGTVLSWIKQGEIRAINVGRRPGAKKPRWRFLPADVTHFELARAPAPPPPRARRKKQAEVIRFY